jgi:hypothetical protein
MSTGTEKINNLSILHGSQIIKIINQKDVVLLLFAYGEKVLPRSPCRTNLLNLFP